MRLLEFQKVYKNYGGLSAIVDVSFFVGAGEILGLIGPNGAGKTTIFNLASGFVPVTSGDIFFDGKSIRGERADKICKMGLCRTFQIMKPFGGMSVLENVMVGSFLNAGNKLLAKDEALRILEILKMSNQANHMAENLTTADKKRLEVARALATRPKMLLLDEVMAGLTSVETMEMVALIRSIRDEGITILVIEHVMRAIMSLSDRIIVVQHGRKISEGDTKFVANDPNVIKAYLGEDYHEST